jgi:TM2 domain-containing membrane protein YozV
MSEESLGDQLKDKASEVADDVKEGAKKVADGAKEAAEDIKEEWNKMTNSGENKKMLAGLLAIFLGAFGVHKFILGYTKEGVIMLVATVLLMVLTCGTLGWVVGIIGVIEGILYLTKSDEEFFNTYQAGRKPWF